MGYDDGVLVSAIVDLAVKRHLTIQQVGSTYQLKQLAKPDGVLPPEERELLSKLFGDTTEVAVSTDWSKALTLAEKALRENLNVEESQTLFRRNRGWIVPGVLLTLGIFAGLGYDRGRCRSLHWHDSVISRHCCLHSRSNC